MNEPIQPPNIAVVVMDTARATETVPIDPAITPTLADLAAELDEWLDSFEHADDEGSVEMADATQERLRDLGYL